MLSHLLTRSLVGALCILTGNPACYLGTLRRCSHHLRQPARAEVQVLTVPELFLCLDICGSENFKDFTLQCMADRKKFLFQEAVLRHSFFFPLTCSAGASGISVGQCWLCRGTSPTFPEEVGVLFTTESPHKVTAHPLLWVSCLFPALPSRTPEATGRATTEWTRLP